MIDPDRHVSPCAISRVDDLDVGLIVGLSIAGAVALVLLALRVKSHGATLGIMGDSDKKYTKVSAGELTGLVKKGRFSSNIAF